MTSSFWEFMWLILWSFFLIAYLMLLFQIIADLFRDRSLGGVAKALWVIGLVFLPVLTALAYLIFRGPGIAQRQAEEFQRARSETDAYIKEVAGAGGPADQIAKAKVLLKEGTITEPEFAALKAKALAA